MYVLLDLFVTFFEIGLFTIGGGYAMIPLIQQEVVAKGWINMMDMMDFIAIAESTPGPFAVNIATFSGMFTSGLAGAVAATVGVVMPSFIIILLIARKSANIFANSYVRSALCTIRPVIVGLIAVVIFRFAKLGFVTANTTRFPIEIRAAVTLFLLGVIWFVQKRRGKKFSPVMVVLASAGLGIILYGIIPRLFA
jgi:chromate transporter